jgi:hypothetical protein
MAASRRVTGTGVSRTARDRWKPSPHYDGDLFLGNGAASVAIGFARMNLKLTAGLAIISYCPRFTTRS